MTYLRKRIILPAIAALCLAVACGAVLYLSYGLPAAPPQTDDIPGLEATVRLVVYENGAAAIDAAAPRDAYAGLGYLHAQEHAWAMTLWQRTARGALSPWFGQDALAIDQLAKRLRLGSMSQAAYAALAPEDRDRLDAYVDGVNAALAGRRIEQAPEFLLLRATPEPWEPWFPLAIERLLAWLSVALPHPDSLQHAPPALNALREEHRLLQEWLHLHGFDHSMAWAITDDAGTHLSQRQVYGASALPLFQEVAMTYPGQTAMGATWIGTPFMPAGRTNARAWAILPESTASLYVAADEAPAATFEYEKWTVAEGEEAIARFRRDEGALFLGMDSLSALYAPHASHARPAPADMPGGQDGAAIRLYLTWPGWEPVSDAAAWFGLLSGADAPFALQDGDGLMVTRTDSVRIIGAPLFAIRQNGVVAAGNNPWSAFAAGRLAARTERASNIADDLEDPENLKETDDLRSAWAARITPRLMATLSARQADARPALFEDALDYLRNWDYAFDPASIPATIADTWARVYFDSLGTWPGLSLDSAAPGAVRAEPPRIEQRIMERTVTTLAERFGENPQQWRWEHAQPHTWYFPVWSAHAADAASAASGGKTHAASAAKTHGAARRYAPIRLPGAGHVTTLRYGVSQSGQALPAPAQWEAWISTASWPALRYRVRRFPVHRPFGRYLVPDRAPRPAVLRTDRRPEEDGEPIRYVTTLLPEDALIKSAKIRGSEEWAGKE